MRAVAASPAPASPAQTPAPLPARSRATQVTPRRSCKAAIDQLGDLDYPIRMDAARRCAAPTPAIAVPALLEAVSDHADGYVRFRALVLLSGFNDPRIAET